jgi:hypothetical protein
MEFNDLLSYFWNPPLNVVLNENNRVHNLTSKLLLFSKILSFEL